MLQEQSFQYAGAGISLKEMFLHVRERIFLIFLAPVLVAAVVYVGVGLIPSRYTAVTRIIPPAQTNSGPSVMAQALGSMGGVLGLGGVKNPLDQYISFLRSRSVQSEVAGRFDFKAIYGLDLEEEVVAKLSENAHVYGGKDGIVTIEFEDVDPVRAAKVANYYVTALAKMLKRLALSEAKQRRLFYEQQVAEAKGSLLAAETRLHNAEISSGDLRVSPVTALPQYLQLQNLIAEQEARVAAYKNYLTEASPELKAARAELARLQAKLSALAAPSAESDSRGRRGYLVAYRDYKYQEAVLDALFKQLELAKIDESKEPSLIQVVDDAVTPQKASYPRRGRLTVIALALSFLMSIFVAVARGVVLQTRRNTIPRR